MTALIILTVAAALLGAAALAGMFGGRLRLQEAAGDGWRFMLAAGEPHRLDRHDRSELSARLWVP